MRVTYNWLKDFVEIKISPKLLAEKLTMAGLEVTSQEEKGGDSVFEIEVTSNRPDWLSVVGIAREVAAITNKKLRAASCELRAHKGKSLPFTINIENKKDCPLYIAKIIRGIKVSPSPAWLKNRLELLGCRSVNNIVDITNYILFETGEPLHAFDLDRLKDNTIMVRRARQGEKITTIDGEERVLSPDILVIADTEKPVAIAGVMGSKDTEVTEATKNILLEAAVFNPIIVRRGKRGLGIQSDSSYRFERGVDLEIVESASCRALELIQESAGGTCVTMKNSGLTKAKRRGMTLELSAVNKILGINIPVAKAAVILSRLGFKIKARAKKHFTVEVPSHRPDVTQEIDLIEEIARIHGYDNIPKTQPMAKPQVNVAEARGIVSLTKNILAGLGLNEVITYSLTDKDLLNNFKAYQENEAIEILNPISKEQEILRPTLIPSLAACAAYNLNQKQDYINIFEVAKVFSQSKAASQEELKLGIALCGIKSLLLQQGLIKDSSGLLHLKGILEALFGRLGVKEYGFRIEDNASIIAVYVDGEKIGLMAKLEKSALESLEIKNKDVFLAEISLDKLSGYIDLNKKFERLPIYPGISRDISFILKEDILAGDVLAAIRDKGQPLLEDARVTDHYKGKQIPSGFKGLTVSCFYRSRERTLTETEINSVHAMICKFITDRFGCKIR